MHPLPSPGTGPAHAGRPDPGRAQSRPVLTRRAAGRIVGGVAGGVGDHLGVDPFKVRVAFVLLSALSGAGFLAYGLLWIVTKPGTDVEPPSAADRRRAVGLIALGAGLAVATSWLLSGTAASALVPVVIVATGVVLVWREFDPGGPRGLFGLSRRPTVLTWARIVGGVSLVVLGLGVVVLGRVDMATLRSSVLAVVVTLIGVGLLTVPIWLRTTRALNAERAARIRNEEREEIASHLHDSVLQTLALIQKQSERPQEVNRLARSQERELRRWLFSEGDNAHDALSEALQTVSGEVEDQYGVTVRPVIVGDLVLAPGARQHWTSALLGATREALVNAAKHSGESRIDLYVEVEDEQVSAFVRDRGKGFDPDTVPEDRQGLARSIRTRVERRGGRVEVRSTVGRGTEVRIHVPRTENAVGRGRSRDRRPEENQH